MPWTASVSEVYQRPEGTSVEMEFTNGTSVVRREFVLQTEADIGAKALEIEAALNELTAREVLEGTVRQNFVGKKYGLDGNGKLIEIT